MANQGIKEIECPHCGHKFETDFYTVIRGDKDIELKEMIISGELNLFICPECRKMFNYDDTFIYIDPQAELLIFVFPPNESENKELIAKMEKDYEIIKESLSKEYGLKAEPLYFFGLEKLSEFLIIDRDIEEETDVIIFTGESMGAKKRKIAPSFARKNDLPFYIPSPEMSSKKNEILELCRRIFTENDRLKRLGNFIKFFEENPDKEIPFI